MFTKLIAGMIAASLTVIGGSQAARAATVDATIVIESFNSDTGLPFRDTSNAVDGNESTFLSLPTDSFITLGFSGVRVFDAVGQADLFIGEVGNGGEDADVFVSSDNGSSFTFLARAFGNQVTNLDLADIGFTAGVNAVKIVGLDRGGSAPGFDLSVVRGLENSVQPVPLPAGMPLLIGALAGLGWVARRRSSRHRRS